MDETHVEHAVGLVEHEDLDPVEPNGAAAHQVAEPARRCNQHIDAMGQRADLRPDRHTADRERDARPQMPAVGLEAFDDLAGELARRTQDKRAAGTRLRPQADAGEVMEHRQCESRCLAGSGLCDADDIARGEHVRNRLRLDRGRGGIALVDERAGDGFGKAEIEKGGQVKVFHMAKAVGASGASLSR